MDKKPLYFASDFHLGFPSLEQSRERERRVVAWLEWAAAEAGEIYLLGDIFDFWFEYRQVVPRGYVRFLGCLAKLADAGIPVHTFAGNHDMWLFGYLTEEAGVQIHRKPLMLESHGYQLYMHHGHALGKYDRGMNVLNAFFDNPFCQWMFARIHPNASFGFAKSWSQRSRGSRPEPQMLEPEKEWLIRHSYDVLKDRHFDYFVYGHRHVPKIYDLGQNSKYINTGTWLYGMPYTILDAGGMRLCDFSQPTR